MDQETIAKVSRLESNSGLIWWLHILKILFQIDTIENIRKNANKSDKCEVNMQGVATNNKVDQMA